VVDRPAFRIVCVVDVGGACWASCRSPTSPSRPSSTSCRRSPSSLPTTQSNRTL